MTHTPSNRKLAELAGISVSYADKIRRGVKTPSLIRAIHIYNTTGLKFGPIASMTESEVETVAKALAA